VTRMIRLPKSISRLGKIFQKSAVPVSPAQQKSDRKGEGIREGWASVICHDPLVVATWSSLGLPFGLLSMAGKLSEISLAAFVFPASSLEEPGAAEMLAQRYREYVSQHPNQFIRLVANTRGEQILLDQQGINSSIVNANCFMNETVFKPCPDIGEEFDAVYNGRLHPQKRHFLLHELNSVALVFFRNYLTESPAQFHATYAQYRQSIPQATFINPLTVDGCKYMPAAEVNQIYARSKVGLCLSAIEGTMRVSAEYLLAGLPVVSTRSKGGRDYFFDDDYCLIIDDNPRAVRDAVDALISRKISREYIRRRTLEKIRHERSRFAELVDGTIEQLVARQSTLNRIEKLVHRDKMQPWRDLDSLLEQLAAEHTISL
jgi:hypothetical protein